MMKAIQEKLLFLYKFSRSPRQIGSIVPSSAFLAMKMVQEVPWSEVGCVVELGAGTGAITKYMHISKNAGTKMILFENDVSLCNKLTEHFPESSCYRDARYLQEALCTEGIQQVDCILSGLPFYNFSQHMRDELIHQIVSALKPNGLFVAFQYSQQMKEQLSEAFYLEKLHFVLFNFPPAFVYVCRKK